MNTAVDVYRDALMTSLTLCILLHCIVSMCSGPGNQLSCITLNAEWLQKLVPAYRCFICLIHNKQSNYVELYLIQVSYVFNSITYILIQFMLC